MISIKSLRIDYEMVTAVLDLNLEVPSGTIFGLVGPNGAGKTSTIKALAGILEPTYGEIKISGCDMDLNPQQALLHVGFMPDFPPVYENLKVWEYLEVFATAYKIKSPERLTRARTWVERVNLQDKWDSLIRTLSRGMRQRLILAKTLLHDPDVLLMDEPASGLDPIGRAEMRKILQDLAKQGKTIIISSHILTELSEFCTAIGVMEKGRLVVSGTLEEIRRKMGTRAELLVELSRANEEISQNFLWALTGRPKVEEPKEVGPGEFKMFFTGDKEDAAILLSDLVKKNFPITGFYLQEADVEDIFFKIGAKEVS